MRMTVPAIAGLLLAACASEPPPAVASDKPELYDASEAGGRVANAKNEAYALEAGDMAEAHCKKFGKHMIVTGITRDRMSIIFTCNAG